MTLIRLLVSRFSFGEKAVDFLPIQQPTELYAYEDYSILWFLLGLVLILIYFRYGLKKQKEIKNLNTRDYY